MSEIRLEDAQRCPKCEQVGELHPKTRNRDGSKSFEATCRNEKCPWYNTKWVIDTNPDGSVPEPKLKRRKAYPDMPDRTEDVQHMIDQQLVVETKKNR